MASGALRLREEGSKLLQSPGRSDKQSLVLRPRCRLRRNCRLHRPDGAPHWHSGSLGAENLDGGIARVDPLSLPHAPPPDPSQPGRPPARAGRRTSSFPTFNANKLAPLTFTYLRQISSHPSNRTVCCAVGIYTPRHLTRDITQRPSSAVGQATSKQTFPPHQNQGNLPFLREAPASQNPLA